MPLTLRLDKGSALTYSEMDGNFTYLSSSIQYIDTSVFATIGSNEFNGNQSVTGSFSQGSGAQTIGDYSHAEGSNTIAGIQAYYSDNILDGQIIIAGYGDVTSYFPANNFLILDDFDTTYGTIKLQVSQSYVNSGNTVIELYDNSINAAEVLVGSYDYPILPNSDYVIGNYSHAEGLNALAIGSYSHAEGVNTLAIGQYSHAEGDTTTAIGYGSHAEGEGTQAIGVYSHAEGGYTQAIGYASHAEGNGTKTGYKGFNSSDIGTTTPGDIYLNSSYGDVSALFIGGNFIILSDTDDDDNYGTVKLEIASSTFDGTNTIITLVNTSISTTVAVIGVFNDPEPIGANQIYIGFYSHAEGYNTQAIGYYSHAEGNNTKAIGDYSHAEGLFTQAIGHYSHAEGGFTQATGLYSHAEGGNTQAIGHYSHAEGNDTKAIGERSHVEGNNTLASGSYQHVSGKYNTHGDDTSLFIIGNGVDDGNRSDAFKVRQSGSIVLPVTSSATPGWTGTNGEMIFGDDGVGNYVIWAYLGGAWRSGSLV